MKRYPIRVFKYILYFGILFLAIFGILHLIGYSSMSLSGMIKSQKGWMFAAVIGGFALLYPFIGFTKRRLTFHAADRVEDVERVMAMCGFKRIPNQAGSLDDNRNMTFRASSLMKRMSMAFEDKIEITTTENEGSYIEGHRSEVVRAYFRLGTYIV